ncbi:DNA-binding transcriptional activator DevR/DosR (plasmid) [Sulfitobacter pontiacus]|jgi:DNA-binding NarL/FixJ family response regulator|uniref:DNA-binding transcriptional activator DevR/DosR n=2 Tax=Sulfitobacter TaxID=60136 RepID=A0AAX3AHA1_9RHOB|nr:MULTISPECIES: response regulator transcription factor [Sulfitobacter]NKX48259.1 response regulator transcription factor [Rhodobacteraceae bacterium R_SAG8]EAP83640.1 probable two component response regulator transcription regulator protein [Sulfitobacter sp. EE-36]UOA24856.1 DNA-binding transcriptional activator DevR/DosR [Sulfitobacter pontiacus]UWR20761.1 response regulator transcription factor [Sulfitobacter pontiacus]GLO79499.1 DNA-binding response regulator [Sulfitobacter pontiacus]|tara:strand:- start:564 stop:1205 length:642 start_codon:yes stop_codon:yes gene_type:complete
MKRILIVEDIVETLRWLVEIVRSAYPAATICTANSVRTALSKLDGQIDLALIDLGLPDGSGLEILRGLNKASPSAIKVVTTVMGDDASIVSSLSAGADGYLLKETEAAVLSRQLTQLSMGLPAISPSVARRIMEHFRLTGPVASLDGRLTERETEVLTLISKGLRNAEVASALNIAETTVAGYIKIVYRKLGISSRAEAAWHANRLGLGLKPE